MDFGVVGACCADCVVVVVRIGWNCAVNLQVGRIIRKTPYSTIRSHERYTHLILRPGITRSLHNRRSRLRHILIFSCIGNNTHGSKSGMGSCSNPAFHERWTEDIRPMSPRRYTIINDQLDYHLLPCCPTICYVFPC